VLKTLLVDDDRTSLLLLGRILAPYADCTPCQSGMEAKEALRTALVTGKPYDLMFIDIGLGDIDGRLLLKTIREIETKLEVPATQRCKIIMVTATRDLETRRDCDELGADAYVIKPLNNVVLKTRLAKLGLAV
jgi:CheY-like chemotaxis protein